MKNFAACKSNSVESVFRDRIGRDVWGEGKLISLSCPKREKSL